MLGVRCQFPENISKKKRIIGPTQDKELKTQILRTKETLGAKQPILDKNVYLYVYGQGKENGGSKKLRELTKVPQLVSPGPSADLWLPVLESPSHEATLSSGPSAPQEDKKCGLLNYEVMTEVRAT